MHIADDSTRSLDGLAVLKNRLSKDVRNFKGVAYQMPWGMLEKSAGVYDFSRLDAALAQVKAKGMYLLLKFEERTFWTGCNSNFVPSYVAKDGSATDTNYCIAKVWDKATVDHMIRVLQQIALRYKDDPNFLGIDLEETSIGAKTVQADKKLYYTYYDQLKRIHTSVHSVAPNLIINQELNWPVNNDIDAFYAIADNLAKMGGAEHGLARYSAFRRKLGMTEMELVPDRQGLQSQDAHTSLCASREHRFVGCDSGKNL